MNYFFWKKVSNISTALCAIGLVVFFFFKKFIEPDMINWIYVSVVIVSVFVFSEIMKYITNKRR